MNLPESLATVPNIPLCDQTLDQLIAERDYWNHKVESAPAWGAALPVARSFLDACNREIRRRKSNV